MKIHLFLCVAVAGFLASCAEEPVEHVYYQPLTSPGGKFATLPPTVQNSVRAQAGAAEIADISKNESGTGTIYEVYFKNADLYPPLYLASDGSVLTPTLAVAVGATGDSIEAATGTATSGVALHDLPPNVVKTIREKRPTAEVDTVHRIRSGSDLYYDVFFKDPEHNPRLVLTDDGRVVP